MFCSKCGFQNPDDSTFCQNCGARLEQPAVENTKNIKPNSKLPLIIGLIIAAAVVAAIILVLFVFNGNKNDTNSDNGNGIGKVIQSSSEETADAGNSRSADDDISITTPTPTINTPEPTAEETPTPAAKPTVTSTPTPEPTATSKPKPTLTATPEPTAEPTPEATAEPTQAPVQTEETITIIGGIQASASDFVAPYSGSRLMTSDDLSYLEQYDSETQHTYTQIMINEMLARYGFRAIKPDSTRAYASYFLDGIYTTDWFIQAEAVCPAPDISSSAFISGYLNDYERANINFINQWQQEHGIYY